MDNCVDIPFFHKIDHWGTDFIIDRDIIYRDPRWDPEIEKLARDMAFKDKEALIYAVNLYHIKKNQEFVVKEGQDSAWKAARKHGCSWKLCGSEKKMHNFVKIMKYVRMHNYVYARLKYARRPAWQVVSKCLEGTIGGDRPSGCFH